jgi:hypothetical protein
MYNLEELGIIIVSVENVNIWVTIQENAMEIIKSINGYLDSLEKFDMIRREL